MLSVENHIAYLVTVHDCVIMPGFGALVSLRKSAIFNEADNIFSPPCRLTSFNPDINHNDAMVAASIARLESIPFDRADETVREQIESWKRRLDTYGSFSIEGVGSFHKDDNGSTIFTPSGSTSVANSRFIGLPTLSMGASLTASESDTEQPDVRQTETERRTTLSSRVIRAAASVAIIVTLLATIFTAALAPESPLYYASLLPSPRTTAQAETIEADRPIELPYNAELKIAMVDPRIATVDAGTRLAPPGKATASPLPEPAAKVSAASSHDDSQRYYLIVASLSSQKEVERYLASVSEAERSKLAVLPGNGRLRVYVASGHTFDEANSAKRLDNNSKLYPDAWVYVKR